MKIELNNLFEDHEIFHSEFQIKNFILWEFGNDWGKYKQVLREIEPRRESLAEIRDDLRLAQIAFKGHKIKNTYLRLFKGKEYKIKRLRQARHIKKMVSSKQDLCRELSILIKIAIKLKRDKFSCLTDSQKRNLEAQMWFEKARVMAAIEIMTVGSPSKATIEFILSMPKSIKRELLLAIHPQNRDRLIAWAVGENASNRNIVKQKDRSRLNQR